MLGVGCWQSKEDKVSSSGPKYFQQTLMQKSGPDEFVERFVAERNDELHATEVRTLAPAAVAARQIIWCPEPTVMSEPGLCR